MRNRRLLVALAFALLVVPAGAEEKGGDLAKLDGSWKAESASRGGKPVSEYKAATWTVNGGKVTYSDGKVSRTHRISVDASKTPKAIDFTYGEGPNKGKTSLGIYKLEGDRITLCWSEPGKDRPGKFESKPASGILMQVLVRRKP